MISELNNPARMSSAAACPAAPRNPSPSKSTVRYGARVGSCGIQCGGTEYSSARTEIEEMKIQTIGPRLQAAISATSVQSRPRDSTRRTGGAPAIDSEEAGTMSPYTSRSRSASRM